MANKLENILTKEMLEYEYAQTGSMQKVADKFDVSVDSVVKYMRLCGLIYNIGGRYKYICDDDFFSQDNESSFYWAGFLAADGSLQRRKYSKIIKLRLSDKDIDHLEKFRVGVGSNHPIKIYAVKPNKLVKGEHKCCEIQIVSSKMFDDLGRFNIVPNKTKIYDIPNWMVDHPLANHFMRGYFDGDGSISKCGLADGRKVVQGSFSVIGNLNFIKTYMQMLVKGCGTDPVKIVKDKNIYVLKYSGNQNIKKIYNFLYSGAEVYLNRKKINFMELRYYIRRREH